MGKLLNSHESRFSHLFNSPQDVAWIKDNEGEVLSAVFEIN
jgi:hypothetical protein